MDCSPPGFSPMGFSKQEYWSGLPFPSPGDLLDSGIEPGSPAFRADALTSEPPGKPSLIIWVFKSGRGKQKGGSRWCYVRWICCQWLWRWRKGAMSQKSWQPLHMGHGPQLPAGNNTGTSVLHLRGTEFFQQLEWAGKAFSSRASRKEPICPPLDLVMRDLCWTPDLQMCKIMFVLS